MPRVVLRQVPWPVPLKISGSSSPSAVGSQPLLKVQGNHPFFHPVLILQLQETPEILLFLLPGEPQKGLHPKEEEQTKLQAAFRTAEREKIKIKRVCPPLCSELGLSGASSLSPSTAGFWLSGPTITWPRAHRPRAGRGCSLLILNPKHPQGASFQLSRAMALLA